MADSKMRRCKKSRRALRIFTPALRAILFHGYKIEILNNHSYTFLYEWKITAPKARTRGIPKIIFDPTSHRSPEAALSSAKAAVSEMLHPVFVTDF